MEKLSDCIRDVVVKLAMGGTVTAPRDMDFGEYKIRKGDDVRWKATSRPGAFLVQYLTVDGKVMGEETFDDQQEFEEYWKA